MIATENEFECIWIEVKILTVKIYYVVAHIDTQTLSSKVCGLY